MFFNIINRVKYACFDVYSDWEIGYCVCNPYDYIFNDAKISPVWFKQPISVFCADPFVVAKDNKIFLFYEEYIKAEAKGIIKCKVLNSSLDIIEDVSVLILNTHLSFPFIFEDNGHFYMMPENAVSGKLTIYRATNFPFQWETHSVLLEEPCSDAILYKNNEFWHLIYTKAGTNENGTLYMRTAKTLWEDWNNINEVIVINSRKNDIRNAGNFFRHNNRLFRFSQKCDTAYGESLLLKHITFLNETKLYEEEVKTLQNYFGANVHFHSLNFLANMLFFDRRIERKVFSYKKTMLLFKKFVSLPFENKLH